MSTTAEDLDTGFDLSASMDGIAGKMGLEVPGAEEEPVVDEPAAAPSAPEKGAAPADKVAAAPLDKAAVVDPAAQPLPPPKSWKQEKHDLWSKLPRDAQEYYAEREKNFLDGTEQYRNEAAYAKQLREVITPYKAVLAAQGISEPQAVQYLLNAHYQLTNGTAEERARAYRQIGEDLGLVAAAAEAGDPNAPPPDPKVQKLEAEVREMKTALTNEQQQKYREAQQRADADTNAFYADAANIYLNEVANDMVPLVKMGHSLKDAYTKAVWGNPVTREKELARIKTEAAENLKKSATTEVEAARKATSTNVRTASVQRAPTEPKGKMFEDMNETLQKIKARH